MHILSSGKSTDYCREFRVLQDGKIDEPTYRYKAFADSMDQYDYDTDESDRIKDELKKIPLCLYGRLIEIYDSGNIKVKNEVFKQKKV